MDINSAVAYNVIDSRGGYRGGATCQKIHRNAPGVKFEISRKKLIGLVTYSRTYHIVSHS
jgi:hypothetical protein